MKSLYLVIRAIDTDETVAPQEVINIPLRDKHITLDMEHEFSNIHAQDLMIETFASTIVEEIKNTLPDVRKSILMTEWRR
jgi:hypothetical protein